MANPTVESTTGSVERANISTDTISSHTITSANRIVAIVTIGTSAPNLVNVNSVTWNGVNMTNVVEKDDANFEMVSIWELANPATGNKNAVCNLNALVQQFGWCVIGVNNASTSRTASTSTASTNNPSMVLGNSQSGDLILAGFASDIGNVGATTPGGTQLFEIEDAGGGDSDFNVQSIAASGNDTVSLTSASGGNKWVLAAYAIAGTGGAAAANLPFWQIGYDGVGGGRHGGHRIH